jgi:hypothetical protein
VPNPINVPAIVGGVQEAYSGERTTFATGADVEGGQLCEITGDMEVGPAGSASTACVGVAVHSASPTGEYKKVSVAAAGVWYLKADGAVNASDALVCAADGAVAADNTPTAGTQVGIALEAIDTGTLGRCMLTIGGGIS